MYKNDTITTMRLDFSSTLSDCHYEFSLSVFSKLSIKQKLFGNIKFDCNFKKINLNNKRVRKSKK